MCGIAGFFDSNKKLNKLDLKKMTDVLHHRGPDDSGYNLYNNAEANVGLGHRRLSVLDLSSHGHQPMLYENLEIIYNGEVYNFKEIRAELEHFGYKFESNSDTEVILKAYHKWNMGFVKKLNGMFAIAIYDKLKKKIILIRDRAGVKPLYYYWKNNIFLFASELKSFYKCSGFEKEIRKESIALFLKYGYIPQPYSIFQNTYKLEAGTYLVFDLESKEYTINRYWNIDSLFEKPKLDISFDEAKDKVEELLKKSFQYRMVADVPLGVFLSGGYDSSAVTSILQANSMNKIKTFTIGFTEEKYNEAAYAKQVAEYLGTEHYEYYLSQKDALKVLPILPEIFDEPFGDSSAIPTIMVSQVAREHVIVSLSADGGDELFSGYPSYKRIFDLYNKIPKSNLLKEFSKLGRVIDPFMLSKIFNVYNFEGKFYKFFEILKNCDNPSGFYDTNTRYFYDEEICQILNRDIVKSQTYSKNNIDNMLAYTFKTYLNDDILTKVDRATMSVGLEGREPFLDFQLIEFVSQLPIKYKQYGDETKYLLKEITHKYIPKKIMDRKKMGFSIPIFEWFKDELKEYFEEYLNEKAIKESGVFQYKYVEKLKNSYMNGFGNPHKLWLILMYQMWWKKWIK